MSSLQIWYTFLLLTHNDQPIPTWSSPPKTGADATFTIPPWRLTVPPRSQRSPQGHRGQGAWLTDPGGPFDGQTSGRRLCLSTYLCFPGWAGGSGEDIGGSQGVRATGGNDQRLGKLLGSVWRVTPPLTVRGKAS